MRWLQRPPGCHDLAHPQPGKAWNRVDGDLRGRYCARDLKARLLDLPLVTLLGAVRESVLIYGSGGFTSYSDEQLERQFCGWVEKGISA